MFRKKEQKIENAINAYLRNCGLETPLLQKRLIESWPQIVGPNIAEQTKEIFISNQTLMVKILSPALRQDLGTMESVLTAKLNDVVKAQIIKNIKFY